MKSDESGGIENHAVVSHAEWLAAREALLAKEKEFTRLRDELTEQRRALPWEVVTKEYVHLNQRDVTFVVVSRAPYAKLAAFQKRMGWHFKWVHRAQPASTTTMAFLSRRRKWPTRRPFSIIECSSREGQGGRAIAFSTRARVAPCFTVTPVTTGATKC